MAALTKRRWQSRSLLQRMSSTASETASSSARKMLEMYFNQTVLEELHQITDKATLLPLLSHQCTAT